MTRRIHDAVFVCAWAAAMLGCTPSPSRGAERAAAVREPPRVASNILRQDYAGSDSCRSCHPSLYARWLESPMHRMTRHADPDSIQAPFTDTTFQLGADTVSLARRAGQRFLHLRSASAGEHLYRITKVIGGRYREDFVGIELSRAADPVTARGLGQQQIMPVSYVFSTHSLRYKGYSVLVPERPYLQAGPTWAKQCVSCHNTLPYLSLLFDDLLGERAESYQGSFSDDLLPPERHWSLTVDNPVQLARELASEIAFLGGDPVHTEAALDDLLLQALRTTRRNLEEEHFVELGIGCESCHGGSRAHAEKPSVLPSFDVQSPLLRLEPRAQAATSRASAINRTCARCHTVLFSRYPFTWEGGRRRDPVPGGSSVNSGEARDFLLGACANELTCTACHDPHAEDDRAKLQALGSVTGNAVCTTCHTGLSDDQALAAHTHHPSSSAGSACIACHMPRKNMGLGYELTRYHRIASPTDAVKVQGDRPLECALCHAEASVSSLVSRMEQWWGKRYDRRALHRLYGSDLTVNVLDWTLAHGNAHEQAAAIGALAEQRVTTAVPALVRQLAHSYPLVRYFTKHALESITQQPLPIDPGSSAQDIKTQAARWLAQWSEASSAASER